jgi:hypothetical protein
MPELNVKEELTKNRVYKYYSCWKITTTRLDWVHVDDANIDTGANKEDSVLQVATLDKVVEYALVTNRCSTSHDRWGDCWQSN